jgi:hypothetical protein
MRMASGQGQSANGGVVAASHAFKVENSELTGSGGGAKWVNIEEKQKIQGTTISGDFRASKVGGDEGGEALLRSTSTASSWPMKPSTTCTTGRSDTPAS